MFKESFSLYNRHFIKILLLSVLLVLPLTLFCYFATYYLYDQMDASQYPNIVALFLLVINFTLIIPAYTKLAVTDLQDDEQPTLLELLKEFTRHFGLILIITIPFYIIGVFGSGLLYIPTVFCFAIIVLLPFFSYQPRLSTMFRQVFDVLKNEHIFLLIDFLILICLQYATWNLVMIAFSSFENSFFVFGIAKGVVNSFIFPFLVFYLTIRYRDVDTNL